MLILGIGAGLVWLWLAKPAEWVVRTDGNIVLTEIAARDQFGVIVVFVIAGAVASLTWGWLTSYTLRDLGWWLTPLVVVTTVVAALIAWRVGVALGPVGPQAAVNPAIGESLPSKLAIDGVAPFVVWPLFGVLGVFLATWMSNETQTHMGSAGESRHDG